MPLYKIEPKGRTPVFVIARNFNQAAEVFVTWDVFHGREHEAFTVAHQPTNEFSAREQSQLRSAFVLSLTGIAELDSQTGWSFDLAHWSFE